jgi:hypothetical protein
MVAYNLHFKLYINISILKRYENEESASDYDQDKSVGLYDCST